MTKAITQSMTGTVEKVEYTQVVLETSGPLLVVCTTALFGIFVHETGLKMRM